MNIFSYDIDNKILESKKFLQFEKKINEEKDSKKKGEKELQEFIFNFPTLFPVSEISGNETSIWIPLAQEIELDTGRLDIFATDGVGNIYIIECKLNSNHEMKTIRSQLDNYAAGISDKIKNLGLDDFWIWFREEIKKNSKNQQTLEKIIEEKIGKDDVESVLKSMKNNLKENNSDLLVKWFLLDENADSNNGARSYVENGTYLKYGAGLWMAEKTDSKSVRLSYRLFMDPGGFIPLFLTEKVNEISILNLFKDVLAEAERRMNL